MILVVYMRAVPKTILPHNLGYYIGGVSAVVLETALLTFASPIGISIGISLAATTALEYKYHLGAKLGEQVQHLYMGHDNVFTNSFNTISDYTNYLNEYLGFGLDEPTLSEATGGSSTTEETFSPIPDSENLDVTPVLRCLCEFETMRDYLIPLVSDFDCAVFTQEPN